MNNTALIYQSYVISFVENFALTQIDLGRCYCFVLFESVLNNAQSLHCDHTYFFSDMDVVDNEEVERIWGNHGGDQQVHLLWF